jgi:hypothetical protein
MAAPIDIGVLVAAGDLTEAPRHPMSGVRLMTLEGAATLLDAGTVACPWCVDGGLVVVRQ